MTDELETALEKSIAVFERRRAAAEAAATREAAAVKSVEDAEKAVLDAWGQPREALRVGVLSVNERLRRIGIQLVFEDRAAASGELAAVEVRALQNETDASKAVRVAVLKNGRLSVHATGLQRDPAMTPPDLYHCGGYQWQQLILQPFIDVLVAELPPI